MADNKQIKEFPEIIHGTTAASNVKMTDKAVIQHEDLSGNVNSFNRYTVGQMLCQPVATTANSEPSGGAYTATCSNFPDFAISYTDANGNTHDLIGMKVRVIFTTGINYGSTSASTYPTLNINSTGAIPLLAQGKTMGAGAASAGQSLELTLIPYGNSVAWDADTNVREKSSNETVYVDGTKRVNTVTSGSTDMVTSGAVKTILNQKTEQIVADCSTFGWQGGSTHTFVEFIEKIYSMFGEGFLNIKFLWNNNYAFNLQFSDNSTLTTSGGVLTGFFEDNNTWVKTYFIFMNDTSLYFFEAIRYADATMQTTKIKIV